MIDEGEYLEVANQEASLAAQSLELDRRRLELVAFQEFASYLSGLMDELKRSFAELQMNPNDRDILARYDVAAANYNAATLRKEYLQSLSS